MRRNKPNQKGKSRHFSTPEEIQSQMAKLDVNEDDEEKASSEDSDEDEEESSSEDENAKPKGVSNLIQIENPNRIPKKAAAVVDPTGPVQLSRREREEIEKQKAKERYDKLHAAGKTDQAKADLARLAAIRQKREEEAAKRKEEAKLREEEAKKKLQASGKKVDTTKK